MLLKERINLTKYLIGTTISGLIIAFLGSTDTNQIIYQILVLLAASINQIMLLISAKYLLDFEAKSKNKNLKVFALMIGKTLILGLSFYIAMHKIPEKLLSCILIYIFQLIILTLSIKRLPN